MNVMQNNAKSKTVTASKLDTVSIGAKQPEPARCVWPSRFLFDISGLFSISGIDDSKTCFYVRIYFA